MRIALDTNRYTDMCNGDPKVRQTLEVADAIFLPFIVIGELRAGFSLGQRGKANERILQSFLLKQDVMVLYAGDATSRSYANLYHQLRQQGTPIPTNDLWIAALVVEHSLLLYSRDKHFEKLAQLNIIQ